MTILIDGCFFAGPVAPCIVVNGSAASCSACGEVIYPQLVVLRNHDLYNYGTHSRWIARDMGITVHDCSEQSDADTVLALPVMEDTR